jgi:hypothetical protein
MIIDDDDKITFESPEEKVLYRKYEKMQDRLWELRNDPSWPATRDEFHRVDKEAELLYASLFNQD